MATSNSFHDLPLNCFFFRWKPEKSRCCIRKAHAHEFHELQLHVLDLSQDDLRDEVVDGRIRVSPERIVVGGDHLRRDLGRSLTLTSEVAAELAAQLSARFAVSSNSL